MMMNNIKHFDQCLKNLLTASGVSREDLARYLDVPVPVVNRWLNGVAAPDVYQFQAIANFFGMPYDWFLDDEGASFNIEEVSAKLGLSTETLYGLMNLADDPDRNEAVLAAEDTAVQAVLGVEMAVWEDLDRYTDEVVAEVERGLK